MRPFLSIVIPAYNERERLPRTLAAMENFLGKTSWPSEVIVVDDGSSDGMAGVLSDFVKKERRTLIRFESNRGKGAAVKAGVLASRGDVVLISDADMSTPIEEVENLLAYLNAPSADGVCASVVTGSRRVQGARLLVRQPFRREFSGRVFSLIVRLFVLRGFLDTQCGFKLLNGAAAKEIFRRLTIDGFGFDVEMLYIAQNILRLKAIEAPVQWADSAPTKVVFWRHATRMFVDLFKIRWNDFRRVYERPVRP